jgi:hypothetical protein
MTTVDDQLRVLAPLKPGQVSELAGYSSPDQLRQIRAAGGRLAASRLRNVAEALRLMAERAADLARSEETRKRLDDDK